MNTEIQLHDSEISEIRQSSGSTVIVLSIAYIHESAGVPGRDAGRIWHQVAVITIGHATLISTTPETPVWALGGTLCVGAAKYEEFIPAGGEYHGDAEFTVQLSKDDGSDGGVLQVKGRGVRVELKGEPSTAEEFDGWPRR